jgi:hypothetical protein
MIRFLHHHKSELGSLVDTPLDQLGLVVPQSVMAVPEEMAAVHAFATMKVMSWTAVAMRLRR